MKHLTFKLVTPEKTVMSQDLASLTCPTTTGQITILPGHAPLVSALIPGELIAKAGNEEFFINITGGFVQVRKGGEVVVLADAAEHYFEINQNRAEEARKRAESAMKEAQMSESEYAKVATALERSLTRLKIAKKRSRRAQNISSEGIFKE